MRRRVTPSRFIQATASSSPVEGKAVDGHDLDMVQHAVPLQPLDEMRINRGNAAKHAEHVGIDARHRLRGGIVVCA